MDHPPGVWAFATAHGCSVCLQSVRAAIRAVKRVGTNAQLIVVMCRPKHPARPRLLGCPVLGPSSARLVVDDRNNTIASALGAAGLGVTAVYDAADRMIARPNALLLALSCALRGTHR